MRASAPCSPPGRACHAAARARAASASTRRRARCTRDGQPVLLSAREYAVLELLMQRPGAVLSRAQIEDRLYGWGEEIESNAVSVYVHQLRKKLGADFIRSMRGVGYFLDTGKGAAGVSSHPRARCCWPCWACWPLAALVVGSVTYRNVRAETEALFDYQLRQMALSLRDQGEVAPAQASALVDEQLDFVVQVWTADGRGLYASRAHAALPQRAQLGFADVTVAGQVWRSFSVAMPSRVIQVSQPLAIRRKLAADAAWAAVLPLLLIAPFMAAAAWWLTALALRPLQRVADGVRQRDEQSLQPLPAAGLPDEVAPLVAALNALLQRLGQSLDTQRAFVADAAHELRSPLTALKLQLQLLAPRRQRRRAQRRHRRARPPASSVRHGWSSSC